MRWACVWTCMLACSQILLFLSVAVVVFFLVFCSFGVRDDGVFWWFSCLCCFLVALLMHGRWCICCRRPMLMPLLLIAFQWKWNELCNDIKIMLKINVTPAQIKRGHSFECAPQNFYIIHVRCVFSSLAVLCSLHIFFLVIRPSVQNFEVKLNVFFHDFFLCLCIYIFCSF